MIKPNGEALKELDRVIRRIQITAKRKNIRITPAYLRRVRHAVYRENYGK